MGHSCRRKLRGQAGLHSCRRKLRGQASRHSCRRKLRGQAGRHPYHPRRELWTENLLTRLCPGAERHHEVLSGDGTLPRGSVPGRNLTTRFCPVLVWCGLVWFGGGLVVVWWWFGSFLPSEDEGSSRPSFLPSEAEGSSRPSFLPSEAEGSSLPPLLPPPERTMDREPHHKVLSRGRTARQCSVPGLSRDRTAR